MRRWVTVATMVAAMAACGASDAGDGRTIRVFAAASLTDAFTEVAEAFEGANPSVTVELNFAGSSALAAQIQEGAPTDVFASADRPNMQKVIASGDVTAGSEVFARNQLVIAVPEGNPAAVSGLGAFGEGDLTLGLCAAEVPCGRYARETLTKAGVTPDVDTNEPDPRALLTKIDAGELDAGIVYWTDVLAAGDAVESVELAPEHNVIADYVIAPIAASPRAEEAVAFIEFVLGADGQATLAEHGFLAP